MERFSDFSKEDVLDGEKVQIDKVLGKDIVVLGYRISESKYGNGKCLELQFETDGKKHILFTGSAVLMRQCEQYHDKMPFIAQIAKPSKYYTFQ